MENLIKNSLQFVYRKGRALVNYVARLARINEFYKKGLKSVFHLNLPPVGPSAPLHIFTFTYNNALLLTHQHRLLNKFMTDNFVFIIADNSPDMLKREEIKKFCAQNKIGYISLPANPYSTGSSSHGICINWICKNYIPVYKPKYFGFIDHDVYPIKRHSIIEYLQRQPFYGHLQERNGGWYLWAGLCFFDAILTEKYRFDFSPCRINNDYADTGGSNWRLIYSNFEKSRVQFPEHHYIALREGDIPQSDKMEVFGEWLHSFNGSYWMDVKPKENLLFDYLNKL